MPAAGLLAAGCGGNGDDGDGFATTPPGRLPAGGGDDADVDLLNGALAAEHRLVAAYLSGLPLLEGRALADGELFLSHERAHVRRLRELVGSAGGTPVGPRPSYDFGLPGNGRDILRSLESLEQQTIAVYLQVVPRVADPLLRATIASIAACEAEHASCLLERLGRWPLPTAFVTGGS
ncbi:ferritin-like domain-containing protein [Conexibacter sp. JD483]|uniref:ferritin-like domain-containing protein n=1 Tax=unclassified Conexibacter TaxID=2627773 RepID=UPI00271C9304|nr:MULTISPECIES: ferritin-like domain-containing protein [unclassified Conexibacter]MDO8188059.1 ferritin-like domain-containing protein [Conexibacter sp. CPCC 205706]MDO8200481.1 ferritin-like domain-containing protein [Conexibacter sp. CPCC 205762]MDR9369828.1 ferritin-like domain-containing protein [Conexibacter sp. JD483]